MFSCTEWRKKKELDFLRGACRLEGVGKLVEDFSRVQLSLVLGSKQFVKLNLVVQHLGSRGRRIGSLWSSSTI